MKVHNKIFKIFGVLLVAALLFAALPAGEVEAQAGDTINVSQPVQLTDSEYYERGQSIVYDGTDYWLFYGRSATEMGWYQNGVPDINDYAIYFKKASSIPDLAGATASAVNGATNCFNGETGAAVFDGKVWTFCSPDDGTLSGFYTSDGGSSWTIVSNMASGMSTGAAHHDEVAFDGKLFVMVDNPDSLSGWYTKYTTTPETNDGWSSYVPLNATSNLVNGTGHFFVDESGLYIGLLRTNPTRDNKILQYNSELDSWTELGTTSSTGWDGTLFKVGSDYVFAQAPWVNEGGGRQYIYAWTGNAPSTVFTESPKMVSEAKYGTNTWTDMWPIGFTDNNGDSFLFFTSERDLPDQEGTGNIWYLKVDWDTTHDHYTYIQEAIDAASDGDTIEVSPGLYIEQIIINRDIDLVGSVGAIIQSPATLTGYTIPESNHTLYPIVFAFGGTLSGTDVSGTDTVNVNISGFEIDANENPADRSSGIMLRNVLGTVSGNEIGNLTLDAQSFGILGYGDSDLVISGNDVSHFGRGGITVNGDTLGTGLPKPNAKIISNTVIKSGTPHWAANGIQMGYSATGSIENNTVSGSLWEGDDWAASCVILPGVSGVTVSGNEIDQCELGVAVSGYLNWDGDFLPSSDITITGNTISNSSNAGVSIQGEVTGTTITSNTIQNGYKGISSSDYDPDGWTGGGIPTYTVVEENKVVGNDYPIYVYDPYASNEPVPAGFVVDASPNWWGSACGPNPIYDNVEYSPWYTDDTMTTTASGEAGAYIFPTDSTTESMNAVIACAAPGSTLTFEGGTYEGGLVVGADKTDLTLELNGATIGSSSPAFTINGDYIVINGPGTLDGGGSSDHAIVVADGVIDFTLDTVEITGWADGLHFNGVITDTVIVDNFIHDNTGYGVYFGAQPVAQTDVSFYIQGNMFKHNTLDGVYNAGTTDVNAEYNSWSDYAGPTGTDGDGSTNADTDTFTHVDLYMVSKVPNIDTWADQVFVDDEITYQVMANMVNVTGAEFEFSYPTLLGNPTISNVTTQFYPVPGKTEIVTIDGGVISFDGTTLDTTTGDSSFTEINGEDIVLFEVAFTGLQTGEATLDFNEDSDLFSMSPVGGGPSNNIYADELVNATLDVIDRPTLSEDDLDRDYVAGITETFTITTDNPSTGGTFSNVLFNFLVLNTTLADISSFQCFDSTYGMWLDMPLSEVGSDLVGYWGPSDGFPMTAPYSATTECQVVFTNPGEYDVEITLDDLTPDPDIELARLEKKVTVLGDFGVTGTVSMQGRTVRSGVQLFLTDVDGDPIYGPFDTLSTSELAFNVLFTGVNGSTYEITTDQPRYLNITKDLDKQFLVNGAYTMNPLELRGGNAYETDGLNKIDISDASEVGSHYGETGDMNADVNFDGKVNIQDLALVGGNFDLTGADAYSSWTP